MSTSNPALVNVSGMGNGDRDRWRAIRDEVIAIETDWCPYTRAELAGLGCPSEPSDLLQRYPERLDAVDQLERDIDAVCPSWEGNWWDDRVTRWLAGHRIVAMLGHLHPARPLIMCVLDDPCGDRSQAVATVVDDLPAVFALGPQDEPVSTLEPPAVLGMTLRRLNIQTVGDLVALEAGRFDNVPGIAATHRITFRRLRARAFTWLAQEHGELQGRPRAESQDRSPMAMEADREYDVVPAPGEIPRLVAGRDFRWLVSASDASFESWRSSDGHADRLLAGLSGWLSSDDLELRSCLVDALGIDWWLDDWLACLPDRNRRIVTWRFGLVGPPRTLAEVAREEARHRQLTDGVPCKPLARERIRQILLEAGEKLARRCHLDVLDSWLFDHRAEMEHALAAYERNRTAYTPERGLLGVLPAWARLTIHIRHGKVASWRDRVRASDPDGSSGRTRSLRPSTS